MRLTIWLDDRRLGTVQVGANALCLCKQNYRKCQKQAVAYHGVTIVYNADLSSWLDYFLADDVI